MTDDQQNSPLPQAGEGPGVRAGDCRVRAGTHHVMEAEQLVRASTHPTGLCPYIQVALTYIRRPLSSGIGRALTVLVLIMFGMGVVVNIYIAHRVHIPDPTLVPTAALNQIQKHSSPSLNLLSILNGFLGLFMFTIIHMRDLFANANNLLMPRYRRVNARIAAIVVVFLVVVLPLIISWATGITLLVLIASTALLFGAMFMAASLQSALILFCALIIFFAVTMLSMKEEFQTVYTGQYDVQLYCALAGGVAMILFGGVRFIWPSEKLLKTPKAIQWGASGRTQMAGPRPLAEMTFLQRLYNFLLDRRMIVSTRHAARASASFRSRVERWEFGISKGWLGLFMVVPQLVFMLIMMWLTAKPTSSFEPQIFLKILYQFLLIGLGFALAFWWHPRISLMAHELLLPVRRKEYYRQLGAAAALSHVKLTAGCMIGYTFLWLMISAETFSVPCLLILTLAFAAWQVFVFGIVAILARHPIIAPNIVLFLTMLLMAVFLGFEDPGNIDVTGHALSTWLYTTSFFGAIGIPLSYIAYRRWLVADVG